MGKLTEKDRDKMVRILSDNDKLQLTIPGVILDYIQFLRQNKVFEKNELLHMLNKWTLTHEHIMNLKELKERHIEFSSAFSEAIMEMRLMYSSIRELKPDYPVPYFYTKLNVAKATYASWKKMGFFQNEFGPEKKRRIPVSDIEEFFGKFSKYRKMWERPD